jgi:hypothetical protein
MRNLAFGALFMGLLVACGGGDDNKKISFGDAAVDDAMTVCNPLTQAGCAATEKCTWIVDAVMPQYVGHIGCAPDGDKDVGAACIFNAAGPDGHDDCKKGAVCSAFVWGTQNTPNPIQGVCKQLCDQQGGSPECNSEHVCVTYSRLFRTGDAAAAGVCDVKCDPLLENDFDGSNGTMPGPGSAKRTTEKCGNNTNVGCYGYPSFGTPPKSGFSCTGDINAAANSSTTGLRHRVQCIDSNGCADGTTIYTNSCNQGYLPLLRESSFVSTAVCIAMCKPAPCWSGECGGANNPNRAGSAGDRCNMNDRVGALYNGGAADGGETGGEHCSYLWYWELSDQGELLESEHSDTLGVCYDHSKYYFDANGNGMIEMATDKPYPNCALLGSGVGTNTGADPTTRFGALNFGCLPTSFLPTMANGKKMLPEDFVEARRHMDLPRALYRRTMATAD